MSAGYSMRARQHILLTDPWNSTHSIDCCVRGGTVSDDSTINQLLAGRGGLEFKLGEFSLTLRPNGAELRALAKAMLQVADELDAATPSLRVARNMSALDDAMAQAMVAPDRRKADPSTAKAPRDTSCLWVEIATLAHGLKALLIETDVSGNRDLNPAAISMAVHIGWLADHAAVAAGGPGNSLRGGEAEAWFLPAGCREAVQAPGKPGARRPGAVVALAQGGAA